MNGPTVPPVVWEDDEHFTVDGVPFVTVVGRRADRDGFPIRKGRRHIEAWLEVLDEHRGGVMVEMGIAGGGSVALALLLLEPARLLAFDLEPVPRRLDDLIRERGLAERVHVHGGVDQGDRATLGALLDADLGETAIDVVIDDASHLLGPTRTTFDVLFPRLRPGGWFLLEDWNWQHRMAEGARHELGTGVPAPEVARNRDLPGGGPLTALAVEALVAKACGDPRFGDLHVDDWWFGIQRGSFDADPSPFSLRSAAADHFGQLPD
jgi:hypothetical protein